MGRRKRKRGQKAIIDDEERWKNAITVPIIDGALSFQVVGLDSPTGTLFVRRNNAHPMTLRSEEHSSPPTVSSIGNLPALGVVLERVFAVVISQEHQLASSDTSTESTVRELCRLGAIWISSRDPRHPQNPPKWNRATESQLKQEIMLQDDVIMRIHSRPPRFPSFSNLQIVTKNDNHGFWVVNKPGGCPSHATVDNGIENALSVVQQQSSYATLPQRLDTETSGLLLVATRPDFARYMGQLLESKTKNSKLQESASTSAESSVESTKPMKPLTKKYRCLVVLSDKNKNMELYHQLCQWKDSRYCITHYVDAASSAPKRFVSNLPDDGEISSTEKWQLCQLYITSVSPPYPVSIPTVGGSSNSSIAATRLLSKALWGGQQQQQVDDHPKYVLELEIDLLTGRTHQIRGQLSALGAPIVGDFLYGGVMEKNPMMMNVLDSSNARACHRMALQCYSLEFLKPKTAKKSMTTETGATSDDSSFYRFHLDHAWWTECLQQYGMEET